MIPSLSKLGSGLSVRGISSAAGLALALMLMALRANAVELPDFTQLVEQNSPAVVNISTTRKLNGGSGRPRMELPDIPEDHPFNEFFRRFFGDREGSGDSEDLEEFDSESLGSGVIISEDGYILTNNHVIADAEEIIVRLTDRRQLSAEVIGSDKRSDIALIKVEEEGLPVAKVGKSADLKVGEWVLAIGSPFGFDASVTAGIVSALGRNLPSENYVPFIQTDVAINPGNSGGPLFNLDGEVVGINAQIYSRTGGFMGLSFAIPIDVAMDVVDQLKTNGRVSRGWLGVLIQDITRELAESFGMERPQGALVAKVLENSPAEKAGIEVGDIIVKFDGKRVPGSANLPPMVGRTKVGSTVKVEVIRGGESQLLDLTIGELPEEDQVASAAEDPEPPKPDRLGVTVGDLSDEQRDQVGLPENGVLVKDVKPGPAYSAGIRSGDVILMLDRKTVTGAEHFGEIVKQLPEDKQSVAVLVHRRGGPIFLALKLGE